MMEKDVLKTISSLVLGSVAIVVMPSASAVNVTAATPEMLVEAFLGSNSGITVLPGTVEYIGADTQAGIYTGFNQVQNGILMTTGDALNRIAEEQFHYSGDWEEEMEKVHVVTGTGSNPQLASLATVSVNQTYDQNVLTFQFTVNDTSLNAISTSFVLASNEYPVYTYPGSLYRDVFGFYVDEVNYAHFSDGSRVIATEGDYTNSYDLGYNGKTGAYSLLALLDPNRTVHTLTIGVADVGDPIFDSGIFIEGLSAFACTGAGCGGGVTHPPIPEPETWAMLLAGLGVVSVVAKRRRR